MNSFKKIAEWVEKKPIVLGRFGPDQSESLIDSARGFEHLTVARTHSTFQGLKVPTLCLLEIKDHDATECYLATATWKSTVSTFETRLTIKKLRRIAPSSLQEIEREVTDTQFKHLIRDRLPVEDGFSILSPKLSAHIVKLLTRNPDNHAALETALALLPGSRRLHNNIWAQEDAIHLAMAAFGTPNATPDEVVLKNGATSGLSTIGTHLYEDNVVREDATRLPGFDFIASDATGRAVFRKDAEQMTIYTANRLPLEKMLGVDLIYINETKGNIVMVQYKMLEETTRKNEPNDWLFRPNKQFNSEVARMQLPASQIEPTDYRLNSNPFFFKFVKRTVTSQNPGAFLVSLDHLKQFLASPEAQGPMGGIRVSYGSLDGTYLRQSDLISLISSGYVGTHRTETATLAPIIDGVSRGKKGLVLGWQKHRDSGNSEGK